MFTSMAALMSHLALYTEQRVVGNNVHAVYVIGDEWEIVPFVMQPSDATNIVDFLTTRQPNRPIEINPAEND
jgi:hypothetical protein